MKCTIDLIRRTLIRTSFITALVGAPAFAAPPINTLSGGFFSSDSNFAILGYDPVAYFTDGRPAEGTDTSVHESVSSTHFL